MCDITDVLYVNSDSDNIISSAYLSSYLSTNELNSIRRSVQKIQQRLQGEHPYFDRVMKFDQINRLQAFETNVYVIALDTAYNEYISVYKLLVKHSSRIIRDLKETYTVGTKIDTKSICFNADFPIDKTIANRHILEAERVIKEVENGFIRNDDLKRIKKAINDTVVKAGKVGAYRLVYTEGTRVTNECVKQAFRDDKELRYYTVSVEDAKVCGVCESVAKAQQVNPVLITDMVVGSNAPPYHIGCRCRIELV